MGHELIDIGNHHSKLNEAGYVAGIQGIGFEMTGGTWRVKPLQILGIR